MKKRTFQLKQPRDCHICGKPMAIGELVRSLNGIGPKGKFYHASCKVQVGYSFLSDNWLAQS